MNWRKLADAFKRLDEHLSNSVYFHGCYLTGQKEIIRLMANAKPETSPKLKKRTWLPVSGTTPLEEEASAHFEAPTEIVTPPITRRKAHPPSTSACRSYLG
jgi:hypothetical protein